MVSLLLCVGESSVLCFVFLVLLFFFFQAEDGIRDIGVTGVQTCALPISFEISIDHNLLLALLGESKGIPSTASRRGICGSL